MSDEENAMEVDEHNKNISENDGSKNVTDDENGYTEHSSDDENDQPTTSSDHAVKELTGNSSKDNDTLACNPSPGKAHLSSSSISNDNDNKSPTTAVEEDDDIFICNSPPPKAPTPPLICLDDGTETEPEVEDKSTQKLPTIHSFENPLPKANERYESSLLKSDLTECTLPEIMTKPSTSSIKMPSNARKSIKRVFKNVSSGESSDDDIQVVSTPNRVPLSGAKRTFNNRLQTPAAKKAKPIDEVSSSSPIISSERHSKEPVPDKTNNESLLDNNVSNEDPMHTEQDSSTEAVNQSPVSVPTSSYNDREGGMLSLKNKLKLLFMKYQFQTWKHVQEKKELRHNMNLIVMEMRASLEADKKHAIETLGRTLEREKMRCVEEAKKKQWCASCLQESRYACCWNTSYCTLACQKRHFQTHKKFCTQINKSKPLQAEGLENKTTDVREGKKVLVLNMLPKKDGNKPSPDSHQASMQLPLNKIITPKAPIQLVSSAITGMNSTVQFMFSPLKPDDASALQSKPDTTKENTPDSESAGNKSPRPTTSQNTSQEGSFPYKKTNDQAEEASLEEIYFPSPPTVSFEGLDTALPDENVHFDEPDDNYESCVSDSDQPSADKVEESSCEEDILLSDNDETDNELVSLGHGVELKAKFLNKCLIYGKTAKRLTRCLVDVLFPSLKLLANCSAFGNKSNVTKLTRAALPQRKVTCIIDYVLKRFPEATKTEIVLAINMKCKEARNIIRRAGSDGVMRKPLFRRLLAKERKQEGNSVTPENTKTSTPVSSKVAQKIVAKITKGSILAVRPKVTATKTVNTPTTITVLRKSVPNIVCVKNSTSSPGVATSTQLIRPKPPQALLQFSPSQQVVIKPKPVVKPQTRYLVPSSTNLSKDSQAVRSILTRTQVNPPRDGKKIMLPVNLIPKKPSNVSTPPDASQSKPSQRPCIIIGAKASPNSTASSVSQKSTCSSTIKRK